MTAGRLQSYVLAADCDRDVVHLADIGTGTVLLGAVSVAAGKEAAAAMVRVLLNVGGGRWVSGGMEVDGSVRKCTGVYGSLRECMGVYGSVWECMGVYGSVWECMGVYGEYFGDGIFF